MIDFKLHKVTATIRHFQFMNVNSIVVMLSEHNADIGDDNEEEGAADNDGGAGNGKGEAGLDDSQATDQSGGLEDVHHAGENEAMEVGSDETAERRGDDRNRNRHRPVLPRSLHDVAHPEVAPEESYERVERHEDDARGRRHFFAHVEQKCEHRE